MIEFLGEVLAWYTDPAQWTGRNTLPELIFGQILLAATSLAVGDGHRPADRPVHRAYRARRAGSRWP